MSLDYVLDGLSGQSKQRFLEDFLPQVPTLDDDGFKVTREAALEISVDLGAEYSFARGETKEAITALEKKAEASEGAEKRRRYVDVAERCKKLSMIDRAVSNYEFAGDIKKAAEVYLGVEYELNMDINILLERIPALEEAQEHAEAAQLCERFGMTVRAIENYRLADNKERADELEMFSDPVKAAAVWERNNNHTEAANLLYRNHLFDELAATHERAGYLVSAGSTYERMGDMDSALRLYRQAKFDLGVEKILRNQGRGDELVAYWKETGNTSKLAAHFEDEDSEQAAGFYQELNDYHKAAGCLVRAGKPVEAIELLVDNRFYEDALRIGVEDALEKTEIQPRINDLIIQCHKELALKYENSDPEKALWHYSELKDSDSVSRVATHLMEQAADKGDFKNARKYAEIAGNEEKEFVFRDANLLLNPSPQS